MELGNVFNAIAFSFFYINPVLLGFLTFFSYLFLMSLR